jgi:ABC-type nitrate/sulfonate/bicarbonate transport system substrate-binding protein
MVPASSPIQTLADLKGRKLAVAGGPIDKSWLLLLAWLRKSGIDLKSEAEIAYGAPPLLAAKTLGGEMDATLNYWNFCAALEAKGFRRVAGIEDLLPKLGAKGRTAMLGYVFDEKWANANQDRIARFIAMTRAAKEILSTSDAEWEKIAPLTGAPDAATLRAYRDRYREGIPRRPVVDEEADARILYRVLAEIGGTRSRVRTAQRLADRLKGLGPIQRVPATVERALSRDERTELQERLTRAGYDTQGTDGRIGPNSIAAITAYQRAVGMIPDGFASPTLLARLR